MIRALMRHARLLRRRFRRTDSRLLQAYMDVATCPKLQIGGGWRTLDGWLNTDIELLPGVFQMDAARPFPFKAETFDYVFVEHMIEHIDYPMGEAMLRECHRVLRPSGVIRVVTPDFRSLAALYCDGDVGIRQDYYDYCLRSFLPPGHPPTRASVANAFFRSWGHQYIYDEETLRLILESTGFANVERRRLGDSGYPALAGLENEERYPPGLLDYESIALEATK
jgi:predicted SAM-dependent methyltransferase